MQIVIEIPEEKYNQIINSYQGSNVRPKDYEIAIINGTPLPKGHGRLIDAEILIKDMENGIKAGLLIDGYEEYPNINSVDDCVFCVECADTILEADMRGGTE